ncbi:MAG: hypothetical protein GC134_01515 [Proteobacteria bacterium]|nr:hypothetical protein [Pseudomonadota bacterium]
MLSDEEYEDKSRNSILKNKHVSFEELIHDASAPVRRRTPQEAAEHLLSDEINEYDRKLIVNTVAEMFETAKMFRNIRHLPKITIFGSARTKPDHPDYKICVEFAQQMVQLGYMIITGAGPGVMAAGHEGAGPEHSIGVNIDLPFEQSVNEFIAKSKYLITYRYFFSRKLAFVREADAIVLLPGGYGTMDEAFETLTLMQTGRSMPVPFVVLDHPGSTYWKEWIKFVKKGLLDNKNISPEDLYLFRHFQNVADAADYIQNFYRRYHSLRYIGDKVVIRLNSPIPDKLLEQLAKEYHSFVGDFGIQRSGPLPEESDEPDLKHLPRLVLKANRNKPVDMYCLVRSLNREVTTTSTRRQDRPEVKRELRQAVARPKREKTAK